LLAFDALLLSEKLGHAVDGGKFIHGNDQVTSVKVSERFVSDPHRPATQLDRFAIACHQCEPADEKF